GPILVPLHNLRPRIEEPPRPLTDARCDVVAFHCTATSMEEGMAGEERVLDAVARAGAPHATTTATAIRRAFDALGARRIVLVTPYSQKTTAEEAEFLHAAGCEVVHAVGHALAGSDAYCAAPPAFWRDATLAAARRRADGDLVSGANSAAMSVIDEVERRLERPVITSNQAVLWDALVRIGHDDVSACPGRLFAAPLAPARRSAVS